MSNILARLSQNENGTFSGTLTTMAVTVKIKLSPTAKTEGVKNQPDFRIYANGAYEVGAAWNQKAKTTGREYLSIKMAAPEFGPQPIYANIIALLEVGKDDVSHLMLWSARETARITG